MKRIMPAAFAALLSFSHGTALGQDSGALLAVGAAAAVAGQVIARAPAAGAVGRTLSSGKDVYHRDAIKTDALGRLQVLLLDETVFTVGPSSEMLIDEFVYDPASQAGTVSAQVSKGVFRFVSGKIARRKPDAVKIKVPGGTIGIRGTIVGGRVNDDGSTTVALLGPGIGNTADERPGAVNASNELGGVQLSRPGFATTLRPGEAPSEPFRLSAEQLASLETKPAAESGAGDPTGSEESAARTGSLGEAASVSEIIAIEEAGKSEGDASVQLAAQSLSVGDPNIANWESLGIGLSGSGSYTASANYDCSGGTNCSSPLSNVSFATIHFSVNWAARTLGGGGSSSHFAFNGTTGVCGGGTCSGGELDSQIPTISFASLTGDAKLTQGTNFSGTNADFNGSSFQFGSGNAFSGTIVFNGTAANSTASNNGTVVNVSMNGSCSGTCP